MKMINKPRTKFRRVMETIGLFLGIAVVAYGFLALVNWSPNLREWTGFSRFIMGAIGVIFLITLFDEL
jgi:uncharacterized membrane protein YcjF (UPF0283 family)